MTTQLDASINLKEETTFGTGVTPDSAYAYIEEDFQFNQTFAQGVGHRAGARFPAAADRVLTRQEAAGSLTVEATTKGLGKLFRAAVGGGVSNLISGSAYQQLFQPTAGDYLPSYTIQKGIPLLGGGAVQPHTFTGMVCSGFELTAPNNGIPTIKFNWVGKDMVTATALASLTYPSGASLFSNVFGSIQMGSGALTPPTTTALASGGTATVNVRDAQLTFDNALDSEGFNYGAAGKRSRKPVVGWGALTGSLTVEFDSAATRDWYLNQTNLHLVLTFALTTAISGSNYPTLQIAIPNIRLEGEIPNSTFDGPVTQSVGFTVLDNRTDSPFYVAIVTAETAI